MDAIAERKLADAMASWAAKLLVAGEDAHRGPRGLRKEETTEVDAPIDRSRPR